MPDAYRVTRWNEIYEVSRTREMVEMRWVAVPVNLSGDGYTLTMTESDGAALYGSFMAILQVAARCNPRGMLVRSNGLPHDAGSIARKCRVPVKLMERALAWFASDEMKWLEKVPSELTSPSPQASRTPPAPSPQEPAPSARNNTDSTDSTDSTGKPAGRKKQYRDLVKLTEHEYHRLVNAYGEWFTERCLDKLDAWKGARGKHTKSDYKAILSWVVGAVNEDIDKGRLKRPEGGQEHGGKYDDTGASV